MNKKQIGVGLAFFSVGLGLGELFASRRIARTLGTEGGERLIQSFGVREIAQGAALFHKPESAARVWVRVAGDLLDLAALATAARSDTTRKNAVYGALLFVAGATMIDILSARALAR